MTDLESQLRSCLSRHSDDASVDPDIATAVARRSSQLARRRPAYAVAAAVPIIAGVVVGAVVLGSSSTATPKAVQVQPAASVTTTPSAAKPTPTALPHASLKVCPAGKIPNFRVAGTSPKPLSEKTLDTAHGVHPRAFSLVKLYAVNGTPQSSGTEFLVGVAIGRHGRAWNVLSQNSNGVKQVSHAKFVGCISQP